MKSPVIWLYIFTLFPIPNMKKFTILLQTGKVPEQVYLFYPEF